MDGSADLYEFRFDPQGFFDGNYDVNKREFEWDQLYSNCSGDHRYSCDKYRGYSSRWRQDDANKRHASDDSQRHGAIHALLFDLCR